MPAGMSGPDPEVFRRTSAVTPGTRDTLRSCECRSCTYAGIPGRRPSSGMTRESATLSPRCTKGQERLTGTLDRGEKQLNPVTREWETGDTFTPKAR
jgi:hypothetical protein